MQEKRTNSSRMPKGIAYIVGNEAAERFSYYGMKAILFTFMTEYLHNAAGEPDYMTSGDAKFWFHLFSSGVYFFPIIGALVADVIWGKYKTIIILSLLYCAGHIALSLDETRIGLSLGLTMIAIGSGGIKPCVSAHVGDQFGKHNQHLIERVFSIFYFAINFGAVFSQLLTPYLLKAYGPSVAFGLPGGLMIFATFIFWIGRHEYISVPAVGWKKYKKDITSPEMLTLISKLTVVYVFLAFFWSLFDQTGSSWIEQAKSPLMNKMITLPIYGEIELLPDQIQSVNPILVMILVPLFSLVIYPIAQRKKSFAPLKRVSVGLFISVISFLLIAAAQYNIDQGIEVSFVWQIAAYFALTVAEVMVSITALEFSYTQAPNSMKSLIMGLYLLSVSLGNVITATVNWVILDADGISRLTGTSYFLFFAIMMLVVAFLFINVAKKYKEKVYLQV